MLSDPIADMFTRLRNANQRQKRTVTFPFSRFKLDLCAKLKENNFLTKYWVNEPKKEIKVEIKYFNQTSLLKEVQRISKPSQRIYLTYSALKKKCWKKGIYLFSTSYGLLTQREAFEQRVGGELIGFIA